VFKSTDQPPASSSRKHNIALTRDGLVIIRCRGPRRILAKRWTRNADGELEVQPYDRAATFTWGERSFFSHAQLAEFLAQCLRDPQVAVLRGGVLQARKGDRIISRRMKDQPGKPAHIEDVPRSWVAFDLDDVPVPDDVDGLEDPEAVVRATIEDLLPEELHGAAVVWQYTGSTGMRCRDLVGLRLWFRLAEPLTSRQVRAWVEEHCQGLPVDAGGIWANQIVYTSGPVLGPGVEDPCPKRMGLLDGRYVVTLEPPAKGASTSPPSPRTPPPPAPPPPRGAGLSLIPSEHRATLPEKAATTGDAAASYIGRKRAPGPYSPEQRDDGAELPQTAPDVTMDVLAGLWRRQKSMHVKMLGGESFELPSGEPLTFSEFKRACGAQWRGIADSLRAHHPERTALIAFASRRATAVEHCAEEWRVVRCDSCGAIHDTRRHEPLATCDSLTCPVCARRRAQKYRARMFHYAEGHKPTKRLRYYLLTFTVPARSLSYDGILEDFQRVAKGIRFVWRTVLSQTTERKAGKCSDAGLIRSIEIGPSGNVHAHALYFGQYHRIEAVRAAWMQVNPDAPIVHVQAVKGGGRGIAAAVAETLKYAVGGSVKGGYPGNEDDARLYIHPFAACLFELATMHKNRVQVYGSMRGIDKAEDDDKPVETDESPADPWADVPDLDGTEATRTGEGAPCPHCGCKRWRWDLVHRDRPWVPPGWAGKAGKRRSGDAPGDDRGG